MPTYSPELTLRAARNLYFAVNGFKGGGYEDRWVKMKAGPFPIIFPNTEARVRSVKLHDLHHILTEYDTTWAGEAEIGAWEIASGCARHYPAWILNFYAFAIGLLINPRGVYRAFLRGRRSSNLYSTFFSEEVLVREVGVVRQQLRLDEAAKPSSISDRVSFLVSALISAAALCVTGGLLVAPLLVLVLLIRMILR